MCCDAAALSDASSFLRENICPLPTANSLPIHFEDHNTFFTRKKNAFVQQHVFGSGRDVDGLEIQKNLAVAHTEIKLFPKSASQNCELLVSLYGVQ